MRNAVGKIRKFKNPTRPVKSVPREGPVVLCLKLVTSNASEIRTLFNLVEIYYSDRFTFMLCA